MLVQEDGDVVERGMQKHPLTGQDTEYEELWHDLEVEAFGKKQNRSTLVMRVEDTERKHSRYGDQNWRLLSRHLEDRRKFDD